MRDIRQDLKERIVVEQSRNNGFREALAESDRALDALNQLLAVEESRIAFGGVIKVTPVEIPKPPDKPLQDFALEQLRSGPKLLDELREAASAAGYPDDGSLGRKIHGALLNPIRAGAVQRHDRAYLLAKKESAPSVSKARSLALIP